MTKYCKSIQLLRGIIFLLILAFHSGAPYANLGWGGVEALFVISSFFLVLKFWGKNDIDIKAQLKHRIARLYPPYIAVIIIALIYVLINRIIPFAFIIHLLSAQNFQWMFTGYSSALQPITAHTWTLSIEVCISLLAVLGLVGILFCIIYISDFNGISTFKAYQLLSYSKNYLNNLLTANIYLFLSFLTTGIVGILYLYDANNLKKNGSIKKAMIKLGDNSYTLYLFHWPILVFVMHLVPNWWVVFLVTFILSVLATFVFNLSYSIVKNRLSRRVLIS